MVKIKAITDIESLGFEEIYISVLAIDLTSRLLENNNLHRKIRNKDFLSRLEWETLFKIEDVIRKKHQMVTYYCRKKDGLITTYHRSYGVIYLFEEDMVNTYKRVISPATAVVEEDGYVSFLNVSNFKFFEKKYLKSILDFSIEENVWPNNVGLLSEINAFLAEENSTTENENTTVERQYGKYANLFGVIRTHTR
ncbi:hypothetical protein C518_2410 [Lysinibacillus fusiformis ZB2]|nr:hypothetical protein C518_2410 [Lysinibacillus fusiformis ZB2]